ncbi:hypothetical protein ACOSQ4_023054 [Xanthoceras sorbifolium]
MKQFIGAIKAYRGWEIGEHGIPEEGLLTCTGLLNLAGSSSIEVYGLGSHMRGDTLIQGVHDSVHVLMNLEVQIVHGVHELHELCEVSIHAAILDIDAVSSSSHHKRRKQRVADRRFKWIGFELLLISVVDVILGFQDRNSLGITFELKMGLSRNALIEPYDREISNSTSRGLWPFERATIDNCVTIKTVLDAYSTASAKAILYGMNLALEASLLLVVVESDSSSVISLISFIFSPKNSNKIAYNLANMALVMGVDFVLMEEVPLPFVIWFRRTLPLSDRPSPLTTSSDSFSLIFSPHLLSSPNMSSLSLFTFPPTGHLPSPTTAIGLSAFVVDSTG